MRLGKALRDPWVWGQAILILAIGALPVIRRYAPPGSPLADLLQPAALSWRIAAVVPLTLGVPILIWGVLSLGQSLTPATQPLRRGELVVHGAYELVRHPIYLGLSLCLWSMAWFLTNPWVGIGAAVVSFAYFDRKAAVEERWMQDRFPDYAVYRQRVRKLIPGIR